MTSQRPDINLPENRKKRVILTFIFMILISLALGAVYLGFAWNRHRKLAESEALRLAQSLESLLHTEHIHELSTYNTASDEHLVGQSLVQLVESTDEVYYAYILKYSGGKIVVVSDSSAANSPKSVPIRQSSEDIEQINRLPFETGKSLLTKPLTDSSGEWIRVLAPITHGQSQEVTAVLGLSYSAAEWRLYIWKLMIPDFIIVFCLFILVIILFNLRRKHLKLAITASSLALQEALYRSVFEQAPIGIALQGNKKDLTGANYYSINPAGEAILGYKFEDIKKNKLDWRDITHEDDLAAEMSLYKRFSKGEIRSYSIEKRLIKPGGGISWVNVKVADIADNPMYSSMYICLMEDISERKQSEEGLKESERSKSVFFSHLPGMAYRCKYDENWTMEFVSRGCLELTGYKSDALIDNRKISYNEIISSEYRDIVRAERQKALLKHRYYHHEYEIITKSGQRKWVLARGRGIYDTDGNIEALEGIVLDISSQKKKERQIAHLREHDFLTGLYNRNRMEQEKARLDKSEYLPLSVVVCDIDGLRMINDAYGFDEGDQLIVKTASLIQGCLRSDYALGHEGGGKFIILLPKTDSENAHKLKTDIINAVESYNRVNINAPYTVSVSIGHSTKESGEQKISEILRDAEGYLNRGKLLNQNSSHSSIVSAIMATLYAKSQETEKHGQRLEEICLLIGERLGLQQKDLDDLRLLSKLHDIGKIGIDDRILNKPGKLTNEDWNIMRRHPEIGRRIAAATPQLEHIAEYILHHHERWDGTGYPRRLKGEDIPLASRILAVADAFDAMTEDRIYRSALSFEAAIDEIKKNSGSQFDPQISELFINLMQEKKVHEHSSN